MKRKATAIWNGSGKEGSGNLSTDSGVLSTTPYSFAKRFGDEKGTNPEELIAAALAGCYSMKLSFMLTDAGMTPKELKAEAAYVMENPGTGWKSKEIQLKISGTIPGGDQKKFEDLANQAKSECPVSKVLNLPIVLETSFQG